ncbi:MAG TPA: hypothetical protein VFJ16_29665 [Longimicrobium sp.]|nr:hypothetical protein [Longimicrobium sp.]
MRAAMLVVPLLVLFAAPLAAQPAPDAPVPQHVAYLLDAARDGFAAVRGEGTASSYPIRFSGAQARSEVQVNPGWNVLHRTILPVAGDRAAADAAWARMADEVARVIPAGWRQTRVAETRHAIWQECEQGRGREVALATSLPFEQPALSLVVYRYDLPCPASRPGGGSGR